MLKVAHFYFQASAGAWLFMREARKAGITRPR